MRQKTRRLCPVRPSHRNELWYKAKLRSIVHALQADTRAHVLPALQTLHPRATGDSLVVGDSNLHSSKEVVEAARRRFPGLEHVAQRLAYGAAMRNRDEVDERIAKVIEQSVSVNVRPFLAENPRIKDATHEATQANVDLIKSIPDQYFDKIQDAVETNWANGERWESLVSRIQEIGQVTENRAALIARDQTSKMNSAFNRVRQTDLGIEKYIWRTSEDERVRGNPAGKYPDAESDHWDLDGKTFRWDEPGPCKGTIDGSPCHAGEDVNDRCYADPLLDLNAMEAELGIGVEQEEQAA